MFREIIRIKQKLPLEECIRVLKNETRGVLALLGDNDYPYAVPLNHYYSEEDNALYFHSGKTGHKIDAIKKHNKASFCVYDKGYTKEGEWSLNVSSVIVFGTIEFVEDRDKIYQICRSLSYKFTDDDKYIDDEIKRSGPNTALFKLNIEHISGKLVNES